jgi:hypothetical protein
MLAQNTLETLRHLKLRGMAQALEEQFENPNTHALAFEERLALLLTGSGCLAITGAIAVYSAMRGSKWHRPASKT